MGKPDGDGIDPQRQLPLIAAWLAFPRHELAVRLEPEFTLHVQKLPVAYDDFPREVVGWREMRDDRPGGAEPKGWRVVEVPHR